METPAANLSRALPQLNGVYTQVCRELTVDRAVVLQRRSERGSRARAPWRWRWRGSYAG